MEINLTQFELEIDPVILERGLQYYIKGAVDILSESSDHVQASVDGSKGEYYSTMLYLDGDTVTDFACSCPYDIEPVCKHVAAVVFAMKAKELELEMKPNAKGNEIPKNKMQSESEKVSEILENASLEQLKSFVEIVCRDNREARQLLFAKLTPKEQTQSKSEYKASLSVYVDSLRYQGDIDYENANLLEDTFYDMLEIAEERILIGDYISAVNAAAAVLEQANSALEYADDSYGCIGGSMDNAIKMLLKIAHLDLDEKSRKHLLKYCLESYKNEILEFCDYNDQMLELATVLIKQESEINEVKSLLDAKINSPKYEWRIENIKEMMAKFLRNAEGEDAMNEYKSQNLDVNSFRVWAVENAIQMTDYTTARKLIDEAPKTERDRHDKWDNFKFRLEVLTGTTDDVIRLSRQLLINSFDERGEYYRKLKSLIAPEEWVVFRDELYKDLLDNSDWSRIKDIATWEKDWDTYMKWLEHKDDLYSLSTAERELPSIYYPQLLEKYVIAIRSYLRTRIKPKRSHYQIVTQTMRRMKKLGGFAEVAALANELRSTYANRRALLDELSRI